MKTSIIAILILLSTAFTDELSYKLDKFKSGTPFIRLTIPESAENWRCFNQETYTRFLELTLDKTSADSIYSNMKIQLEQCNDINIGLTTSLKFSHENQLNLKADADSMLVKYNETSKKLVSESFKKWYWGGVGIVVGTLLGSLATAIYMVGN